MAKNNADTAPILLRKITASKFELVYQHDEEAMMHFAIGSVLEARVSQQRSLPQLSLYWVILRLVVENSDKWSHPNNLHRVLKILCGLSIEETMLDGVTKMTLDGSISIAKMDQAEFRIFFDNAMNKLREAGYPVDDYLAEAHRMTEQREQKQPAPYHKGRFHESHRAPDRATPSESAEVQAQRAPAADD